MDQWLVRTAKNWIGGPYSKEQVCQMILERKLDLQDEVCAANGYWIFLHEKEEVRNLLGISVPSTVKKDDGEEVTETQLQTDDEITDHDIATPQASVSDQRIAELKKLESLAESVGDHTAMFSTQQLQDQKATSANGAVSGADKKQEQATQSKAKQPRNSLSPLPQVEVIGQVEHPSVWKGFIWTLTLITLFIIFLVLKFLKH